MCWYLNKKGSEIPMLQALPRQFHISVSILSHSRWRYGNNTSGVLLSLWWAGNRELHTEFTSCNFLITAFLQLLPELWCVRRWLGDCWWSHGNTPCQGMYLCYSVLIWVGCTVGEAFLGREQGSGNSHP